jgi:uncharacterized membrane protein
MLFNAVFRAKARAALAGHWQTALLIALIVNLPSLLVQGIGSFTNSDPITRLQLLALEAANTGLSADELLARVGALFSETGVLLMSGFSVLAWIVTPVLSLGMNHWALDRLRGLSEPVSAVFSRLPVFLKSIGLRLLITLKVILWMLPGVGVSLLYLIPLNNARNVTSEAEVYAAVNSSIRLLYVGIFVMIILGVFAYLHYALADFILADEPEERILSCVRRSKQHMAGRKGSLLSLVLSFALWYLLLLFITSFLSELSPILGLLLQMLGSLVLSTYVLLSVGAFYEAVRMAPQPSAIQSSEDENSIE